MKAKSNIEEGGDVEEGGLEGLDGLDGLQNGVRPALKSFLHQVISDQPDKQDKPSLHDSLAASLASGRRTVSALSRLIDPPSAKPTKPVKPAKPSAVVTNGKTVANKPALRKLTRTPSKDVVKDAAQPNGRSTETTAVPKKTLPVNRSAASSPAVTTTTNGTARTTAKQHESAAPTKRDEWWRERVHRPAVPPSPKTAHKKEPVVRKASDSDARSRRAASPARKPSFKVSAHRTSHAKGRHPHPAVKVTIPASRVQALATKFNSLEEEASSTARSPPPVTTPPDIKIVVGNRAGVIKAVPPAIMDEVVALSALSSKVAQLRKRPSFGKTRGSKVKAAVKIFEPTAGGGPSRPTLKRTTSSTTPTPGPAQVPAPSSPPAQSDSSAPLTTGAPRSPSPSPTPPAPEVVPTAIPDVPKIDDAPAQDLQEWASSLHNASPEAKTKRSQNKSLLKTAKTVLSEEKRLVVVNIEDIDAVPPLPLTPPPPLEEGGLLKEILDLVAENVGFKETERMFVPPQLPARNASTQPRQEDTPEEEKAPTTTLKANSSFLWRSAPMTETKTTPVEDPPPAPAPAPTPAPPTPDGPSFRAVPAVIQPDASDDQDDEVADELYDDVVPPTGTTENIYDDISVKQRLSGDSAVYETCGNANYDDCEGEGYQFVDNAATSAAAKPSSSPCPPAASPAPPALQDDDDALKDEGGDNIYDDVLSERKLPPSPPSEDAVSTSGVYEAIYLVRGSRTCPRPLPAGIPGSRLGAVARHGSTCSSSSSSRSSSAGNASSYCGKINSIYGEPLTDEQAMAVAAVLELPFPGGPGGNSGSVGYQAGRVPLSETSDEWVDLDNTPTDQEDQDDEETIVVFRDQPRRRRATSWSRKVRTQRSKSPRRRVFISSSSTTYIPWIPTCDSGSNPLTSSNGHGHNSLNYQLQYKSVFLRNIYTDDKQESQELSLFVEKEGDISTDSENENPYESLYENPDAIDDIDSFDSDSEDELRHHDRHPINNQGVSNVLNGKLPEVPPRENIYGVHVMRFKEAAGKKMQKLRKNWSLRKNDISNKLSRIRRKSSVDPRGAAVLSTGPQSSPPRTPPMEKCQSSGQLAGNKYWSFKSKFRRSQSTSTALGSTFYLTEELPLEKELPSSSGSNIDSNSIYIDSSSPASQRSNAPSIPLPPRPASVASQQNSISERRNSSAMRPNSPPPPPPPVPKRNGPRKEKDKTKLGASSWYAECGLFDSSSPNSESAHKRPMKDDPFNTSLYAEAGLWDNMPPSSSPYDSSQSEHDASQTTEFSDSSGGQPFQEKSRPLFSDEPLYQFYNASVFELARRQEAAEGDSDGYEEIVDGVVKSTRPSAMELIRPREGKHRTLWCEIPEVRESGVLDTLSAHEKKLQEAKFELITSEASYVKSLNVLERHFMNSAEFRDEAVLSKSDRRILFSNVNPVRTRSEKFLADMEHCWQDSIMLQGICDIVRHHASEYFNVYTKYCTNQIYLDRTLKKLREGDSQFSEALLNLESSPECQSLSLHSFLMLPMQRITRLPLLLVAVLNRLGPDDDEYHSCELALASLNKIVAECNEGARKMERYEEMMLLSRQLEFPHSIKPVPIISSARWLVRSGALTQLVWRGDDAKLTFGRKVNKISVHLFLFTDILVVTKRKSEDNFSVLDYCPRNLVQISSMEDLPQPQQLQLQPPLKGGLGGRHLVLLTLLQNQENKTVEMVLSCGSESDRERWLAAVSPPQSDNPNEQLYEMWDCPQVRSEHPYVAQQPDELSLDVGDVVNVLRKTKDGWYEGERIRDQEKGWFPGNYTVEIASAHIRAKNLKQRYRLLVLSGSYLQESRSKIK